jgi:hypothetical protein
LIWSRPSGPDPEVAFTASEFRRITPLVATEKWVFMVLTMTTVTLLATTVTAPNYCR